MATQPDPYRTLGLTPAATPDEIRRAYRRLAKENHPDSAGEKALPRFLAIQAAYESLEGALGTSGLGARPTSARQTARERWRADPDRASTARETRGARGAAPDGAPAPKRRRPPSDEPRPTGGRKRPSNKATPGSTTYDAADDEPFEPEWSGGTWYGATSGTYWTINPKEYADPRKHGPEYQRRARRRAGTTPPAGSDGEPLEGPQPAPMTGAWERWPDEDPAAATRAAAARAAGQPATESPAAEPAAERRDEQAATDGLAATGLAAANGLFGSLRLHGGFPARIGLALVGWPPIGVAISTIAGEITGCGRFAASCIELFGVGTWLAQLAVIAILLALPSLAAVSAVGTLAALAASVPTAVILSASGGSREPAASAAVLGGVLAIAYLAGAAFAVGRRRGLGRVP